MNCWPWAGRTSSSGPTEGNRVEAVLDASVCADYTGERGGVELGGGQVVAAGGAGRAVASTVASTKPIRPVKGKRGSPDDGDWSRAIIRRQADAACRAARSPDGEGRRRGSGHGGKPRPGRDRSRWLQPANIASDWTPWSVSGTGRRSAGSNRSDTLRYGCSGVGGCGTIAHLQRHARGRSPCRRTRPAQRRFLAVRGHHRSAATPAVGARGARVAVVPRTPPSRRVTTCLVPTW